MDTLRFDGLSFDGLSRELEELVAEVVPSFIDMEQLERLVTEDDMLSFGGECSIHDGCRPV